MSTKTLWISPTDWVTGDTTLRLSYPLVTHPAVEITTTALGDSKWVFLGLRLAVDNLIKAVRVCYQLSSSNSFISQVRLEEMQEPDHAVVRHDDATPPRSTTAICHVSEVGAYRPSGAVTLAPRLSFANTIDKITLGPVGVDIETCEIDVANVKCFGAVGDGMTDDRNAIIAVHNALPATGGIVYFPSGTYVLSSAITWNKSKATLRGAGMWQSTLKLQTLNGTARLF